MNLWSKVTMNQQWNVAGNLFLFHEVVHRNGTYDVVTFNRWRLCKESNSQKIHSSDTPMEEENEDFVGILFDSRFFLYFYECYDYSSLRGKPLRSESINHDSMG